MFALKLPNPNYTFEEPNLDPCFPPPSDFVSLPLDGADIHRPRRPAHANAAVLNHHTGSFAKLGSHFGTPKY